MCVKLWQIVSVLFVIYGNLQLLKVNNSLPISYDDDDDGKNKNGKLELTIEIILPTISSVGRMIKSKN